MHWINFIFFVQSLCSWSLGLRQVIIKPREKISVGYKESVEAELSYLTERHGFVDDENAQHAGAYVDPETGQVSDLNPAETFLLKFVSKYLQGNNAYDTPITQKYFEKVNLSMRLCPTYLRDPIYDYNNIDLIMDSTNHPPLYELKFVEFQYFTRRTELVKVVRCPVKVGGLVTRLYFLEIHHYWKYSGPLRGYFVFINKVVPVDERSRQPLQLLMYVDPDKSEFPEMMAAGREATLHDSLDLVSSRTMKIRLREIKPQRSFSNPHEVWTGRTVREKMDARSTTYKHYFGEEAEIMLLSKFYGFVDFLDHHVRPWRMKKTLLILDRMAKDFVINREKINAVKKKEPKESCRNYILMNVELTRRLIVPQRNLRGARYVKKIVNFTQFEYLGGLKERKLLRCPIRYGETREPRYIYLLPIHYENSDKLPQLFTFFEDPNDRTYVNVYILSPLPSNVDEVDDNFTDQNLMDLTGVPSTSDPHQYQTVLDSEISEAITPDFSTLSLGAGPGDLDPTFLSMGSVPSDTVYHPAGQLYSYPYPPAFPGYGDVASSSTDPQYSYTAPLLTGPVYSPTDSPPRFQEDSDTASLSGQEDTDTAPLLRR